VNVPSMCTIVKGDGAGWANVRASETEQAVTFRNTKKTKRHLN